MNIDPGPTTSRIPRKSWTASKSSVSDDHVRGLLERVLGESWGRDVSIGEMRRFPSDFATLAPIDVVEVDFSNGAAGTFVIKYAGDEESEHPEKRRVDREVVAYERLLRDPKLPVPRFHGWEFNQEIHRREIVFEHVAGWDLRYLDLDIWEVSIGELARLHRHFAVHRDRIRDTDFLLRLDASYFEEWRVRAIDDIGRMDATLASTLRDVLDDYDDVVELLSGAPVTLVHNDASPKNILADTSKAPPRIAIIDWEMTGVGPAGLDLVHLTHGLAADVEHEMERLYRHAVADTDLLPNSEDDCEVFLDACRTHETVRRLGHVTSWDIPAATVRDWIRQVQRLRRHVSHTRKDGS